MSEAVLALAFPFVWSHVFIPILPTRLFEIVEAPVPFIVGVHSASLGALRLEEREDLAIVDIDRDCVDCQACSWTPHWPRMDPV